MIEPEDTVNATTAPALDALQLAGSSPRRRVLPALAALAYPGLIWCGPAIAPLFLALALAVPLLGVSIAHGVDHRYPRSRWIALAVVATPPLYTLLGGWLDFQRALPFKGLHVWVLVWLSAAAVAYWERAADGRGANPQGVLAGKLAVAHGISAVLITCFAAAHLMNHFAGLWGGTQYAAIQQALRLVYLHPVVEAVLLGCIAFQVASGLCLLARRLLHAIDWFDSLQAAAGLYFAVFFMSHLSAVLRARHVRGTDTNWQWLTADHLLTDPWSARLVPYYVLAVVALGIHGGAGIRRVLLAHGRPAQQAYRIFYVCVVAATVLSASIITAVIRGSEMMAG